MEILEHGIYYNEGGESSCVCGCRFKYDSKDVCTDNAFGLSVNPMKYKQYVQCPECSARIYLGSTITHGITQIYN